MMRIFPGSSLVILLALGLAGCGQASQNKVASSNTQRIVSLAPAITQAVRDLGLGGKLVGVAEHDSPAADLDLPVVGSFVEVNTERLVGVRPTQVLLCYGKAGPSPRLRAMADDGRFSLTTFAYPRTIADVADMIHRAPGSGDENHRSLGEALGVPGKAKALRAKMLGRLQALRKLTRAASAPHAEKPRVLLVFGTSPIMASGPGTVNDQLLEYVGAVNAAADATVSAPTYDHESLIALRPDVVLLLMPQAPPLSEHDPRLAGLMSLPIPAAEHHRIGLINDPLVLLPSSSLPRIAAAMARAIHPELATKIDAVMKGDGER